MTDKQQGREMKLETPVYYAKRDEERRRALLDQLLCASTPPAVVGAKQAVVDWLRQHPDDLGVIRAALSIRHRPAA